MVLVAANGTPPVFDALPAVKVRHYHGQGPKVYTQGRCFLLDGALHLALSVFERTPPAGSRVAFVMHSGQQCVAAVAGPKGAVAGVLLAAQPTGLQQLESLPGMNAIEAGRMAGQDEQGWYWETRLVLPKAMLEQAGFTMAPAGGLAAALLKYGAGAEDFGSSCPSAQPFGFEEYDAVTIVSY